MNEGLAVRWMARSFSFSSIGCQDFGASDLNTWLLPLSLGYRVSGVWGFRGFGGSGVLGCWGFRGVGAFPSRLGS